MTSPQTTAHKPQTADTLYPEHVSLLLIGDSGTHKTFFAGGMPKPFFFDFDQGMATLSRHPKAKEISFMTFKEASKGQTTRRFGLLEYGKGWFEFIKVLNEIGAMIDAGTCPYETLVFDSFTYMADLCVSMILSQRGVTKEGNVLTGLDQQGWGSFLASMSTVTSQIMAWPLRKCFTAHIKRDVNEITSTTEHLPLMGGQFAGKCSTLMDEVYYTNVEGVGAARKYTLITEADGMRKAAKTRWGVPNGSETSWSAVEPYITGTRQVHRAGAPIKIAL